MTIFNEKTLQDEIHRVWGAYGAHADVYAHILRSNADMLEALGHADHVFAIEGYAIDWPARVLIRRAIAKAKGKT